MARLIYKATGEEVQKGDVLTDFRGNKAIASYWREPTHGIGKISVKRKPDDLMSYGEYYVSVFGLEWVEDESDISQRIKKDTEYMQMMIGLQMIVAMLNLTMKIIQMMYCVYQKTGQTK